MPTTQPNIDIYIPRVLGTVSQQDIRNSFIDMKIGNVLKLDMHKKTNENGYIYYFAFIKVHLYNTSQAERMLNLLNAKGIMHLIYDEEAFQYWEVKKHIPKDKRVRSTQNKNKESIPDIDTLEIITDIWNTAVPGHQIVYSAFTEQDRIDMMEEYDELQREIFQLVC